MRVYGSLRVHGRCSAWRTWLDCVYLRTVACDYARLRVGRRVHRFVGVITSPAVTRLVHRASRECYSSIATVGLARTRR